MYINRRGRSFEVTRGTGLEADTCWRNREVGDTKSPTSMSIVVTLKGGVNFDFAAPNMGYIVLLVYTAR